MNGGGEGGRGLNIWIRAEDGSEINIGGKNTVQVSKGDRIVIATPGGGGWGKTTDVEPAAVIRSNTARGTTLGNGSVGQRTALGESA